MLAVVWILIFLVATIVLCFQRASLPVWTLSFGGLLLALTFLDHPGVVWLGVWWLLYVVVFGILNILPLRRFLVTHAILDAYRKVMPTMSETEKEALTAGGVGWTADLFSGMPDWQKLINLPGPRISKEEHAFLDGPVEQLCAMLNNWDISRSMQVPDSVWNFIKANGFFGMIIPKQFGGKEFSAVMHARVISKVSSVCTAVATILSVPNSLGPAELLLHYGTDEQKNHYLPRLANGEDIPCFALTSPVAGSDASSITDYGVVCQAEFNGKQQTCLRLNWDKRYITLAPVATLLGLAFKLYDPEHILGDQDELGITCALIPVTTANVVTGRRHFPLHSAFPNGPTQGKDVIVPIDYIIGGAKMAGAGWRMLMECLAAGRGISLPSMVMGGAIQGTLASGSYARIRRQFNTHIGDFGGIQEALARMVGNAYSADAMRMLTVTPLDHGVKPVVASAIAKCHATQMGRYISTDAMDVQGGKAICMGPKNYLAQPYIETPISITVEGANILTRSMIIFGQGVIRCHPYILPELTSAQDQDRDRSLQKFDRAIFSHIGFLWSNKVRAFVLGLTNGYLATAPNGPLKRYYQQFSRFSAVLAFMADMSMITLGAELKRREQLSARLGDLLSYLYIGSSVLKNYSLNANNDKDGEERLLVKWICQDLLFKLQTQLSGLLANLPNRWLRFSLRMVVMPLGHRILPPSDKLGIQVANLLQRPGRVRELLGQFVYMTPNDNNPMGKMDALLADVISVEPLEKKVLRAARKDEIHGKNLPELIKAAVAANILSTEEGEQLHRVYLARMEFIHVDDFGPEAFGYPTAAPAQTNMAGNTASAQQ